MILSAPIELQEFFYCYKIRRYRVSNVTNELIAILFIIVNFSLVVLSYKVFGKKGLYAYIAMSVIAANIQVSKTITLFGLTATLGNTMFSGIFLATDLLSEKYGKKAAMTAVFIGFYMQLSFLIVTQFSLWFTPDSSDWAQPHMEGLFALALPVFTIAGLVSFIVSQNIDVVIFHYLKNKFPEDKWLWLRNNGSTFVSQFVDTFLFTSIVVMFGLWEVSDSIQIFAITYLFKVLLSISDTPFVYLLKKVNPMDL